MTDEARTGKAAGGFARAESLSASERKAIARKAALALPVPQISLAGLVNHPNSSRSSKAKAMATSWV